MGETGCGLCKSAMQKRFGNHSSGGAAASDIRSAILALLDERRAAAGIDPTEVARRLAGTDEKAWGPLMKPIRAVAVDLAREGRVVIRRKGRVVDPDDFKGVYRLSLPGDDG